VKRVAFHTFGCRLNQYDTETVRTLLEAHGGYQAVPPQEPADVYVVNSCSVTARADAALRKAVRRIHNEHPEAQIVVTGCYAQRAPDEIAELPGVSLVVGAADRNRIPPVLSELPASKASVLVSPIEAAKTFLDVPITNMADRSRAFVKIQEGCNESCTFCIIPKTRGRSRSREPGRVMEEIHTLVENGYGEIVLTGVHIGDYGLDLSGKRHLLPELIEGILRLPGLQRFRLSSIEPASITADLIGLMASHDKFARHFHIPLQSGSNEILARMGRGYTAEHFERLIRNIEAAIPDCGIGTDVICGFPGETEGHFQETFALLQDLPITYLHAFSYSVRPGSEAEAYGGQVPAEARKRRTGALKRLSRDKNRAFRQAHVGRQMAVLFEQRQHGSGMFDSGLTDNYLRVQLHQNAFSRRLGEVRIKGLSGEGLVGELAANKT
jgi:threonylcarbamoyladenosine tRNA methylthiotransferase MtaB